MSEHTTAPVGVERPQGSMETVEERTELGEAGAAPDYPTSADTGWEQAPAPYDEEDVVNVRVVGTPTRPETLTRWQALPSFVGTSSIELVGAQGNRTRLFIRNGNAAGGDSVYLLPDGSTPREFGYLLEAQDTVEFFHNDAVWAQCASGDSANVYLFTEYVIDE